MACCVKGGLLKQVMGVGEEEAGTLVSKGATRSRDQSGLLSSGTNVFLSVENEHLFK